MRAYAKFTDKDLRVSLAKYAGALQKGCRETIQFAARQIARNAQLETVLQTARGRRPRASTVSSARKEQTAAWEQRIIASKKQLFSTRIGAKLRYPGMRLPRRKVAPSLLPKAKMSMPEAKSYIRTAKTRQGELAAAWNAAIIAAGGKPVAQYIARHGAKHGSLTIRENGDTIVATIRAQLPESKMGDSGLAHIPSLAIKKTAQALDTAAKQTIRKEFREAKTRKGYYPIYLCMK